MYDYGPMMTGYGWGWGIVGSLLWLAFLVFIAFLIFKLLKGPVEAKHSVDPLDIAKQRYAKGEIDKDQYDNLKKDLEVK